jgi:hypothetical protein
MARRTTLKDLNDFLSQNPNTIEIDDVKSKEDFLKKSPNNLVSVENVSQKVQDVKPKYANLEISDIAASLHERAKKEGKSFTELWLKILEEGAKTDPLLKNTSVFKTIKTINQTTFNVAMEGISKFIKSRG